MNQDIVILISLGPDKGYSTREKINIINTHISNYNGILYGANFRINKESILKVGGMFPIICFIYIKKKSKTLLSKRSKVAYKTIIEDI